jgi:hypothetical protein
LIAASVENLFADMPFLMVFSILGCIEILFGSRREYFFLIAWLVTGAVFNMSQIYQPIRYYVPLIPAMCLVTTVIIDKRWSGDIFRLGSRTVQFGINAAVFIALTIVCFNLTRTTLGYASAKDETSFLVAQWFEDNVPAEAIAVGPDYLLISLKQKALPFYSFDDYFVNRDEARINGIEYIIFDDHEWATYCKRSDNDFASYLEDHYTLARRINYVSIFKTDAGE